MLTEINGNLFELQDNGTVEWIMHGCNCFKVMGAGLALTMARLRPDAVKADINFPYHAHDRGGKFSISLVDKVINVYSQYRPGKEFNYNYLAKALVQINMDFAGISVGIPQIGAGIGGGNWKIIRTMIEELLPNVDVTIVYYAKS